MAENCHPTYINYFFKVVHLQESTQCNLNLSIEKQQSDLTVTHTKISPPIIQQKTNTLVTILQDRSENRQTCLSLYVCVLALHTFKQKSSPEIWSFLHHWDLTDSTTTGRKYSYCSRQINSVLILLYREVIKLIE